MTDQPEIKQRKNRDDTPSFIRNVQSRAELLNPQRGPAESIPVLTMPKSVKLWRKVRWPLAVLIVVIVLATVGFITNDLLVAQSVERAIVEAQGWEQKGSIKQLNAAEQTLSSLAERHPNRPNVQTAWAWHAVLQASLLGPEKDLTGKAKSALERAGNEGSSIWWAAKAGVAYLEDDFPRALEVAEKGLGEFKGEPRLELVKAWALSGMGKLKQASEAFGAGIDVAGDYAPLIIAATVDRFNNGKRREALDLVERLDETSPGHLYGSLVMVALALPGWGVAGPAPERVKALLSDVIDLKQAIAGAPPKLANLGNYLSGRVYLMAGRLDDAVASLDKLIKTTRDPSAMAWYTLALRGKNGPEAALAFLDKHPDLASPEIFDLRAQCLLAYHRVDGAAEAIKKLGETGALADRLLGLKWLRAVRSGDVSTAKATLADEIQPSQELAAVELYHLLREAGDKEGIDQLNKALEPMIPSCAAAITAWHKNAPRLAFKQLRGSGGGGPCVDALATRFLRGRVPPAELKEITARLEQSAVGDLRMQVERAVADWVNEGKAAALAVLDGVWKKKPEGGPLRCALGRAYLEMGLPAKTLEVLDGVEAPEGLALRVLAATETGDKKLASKLTRTAVAAGKKEAHPALHYLTISKKFQAGKIGDVYDDVIPLIDKSGHWSAEIAEIASRVLNQKGDKTLADRLLYQAAKQVTGPSGLDESWEASLAQIRLNMRRGGKFMFRALYLITTLREEGVRDPRLAHSLAMANIKDGNDRAGVRSLREALALDPTFAPAYAQLIEMGKLDEEAAATMKKMRPELAK